MAWLHATPKESKISRMEQLKIQNTEHPYLELPPIESHSYLIDWLFDSGPLMLSSMGNSPLTYQELYAWGKEINITDWEAKAIRQLSIDYAVGLQRSSEINSTPPYVADMPSDDHMKRVSNGVKDVLMRMVNNGRSGGLGGKR